MGACFLLGPAVGYLILLLTTPVAIVGGTSWFLQKSRASEMLQGMAFAVIDALAQIPSKVKEYRQWRENL